MNIYLSLSLYHCDLPLLAFLYPFLLGPGLSLPFSLFTHFPLAHLLTPSHNSLFTPALSVDSVHFLTRPLLFPVAPTVKSKPSPSKLELSCLYSELSQIQSAKWTHQDKSRKLQVVSSGPGKITAVVPTPITAETAGNYTCTLRMSNGQTVWATESVALPSKGTKKALTRTDLYSDFLLSTVCIEGNHEHFRSAQLSPDNDLGSASRSAARWR